jgi:predicted nuclease of predicted toxin-antitoxin system
LSTRFLVDSSSDARLVGYLQKRGYDTTRVGWNYPGDMADEAIRLVALAEDRIIITEDRDFGELVVRYRRSHAGIIYFRLESVELSIRTARLEALIETHGHDLRRFFVVTEQEFRIRPD